MAVDTMCAVLLTGFGGYDRLVYRRDVPVPTPAADEVLIRVGACGVNNTDVWTREGAYGADAAAGWQGGAFRFPRIQGLDSVGRIVAVGADVPAARLGQRVMVNPTLYAGAGEGLFAAAYLGSERDGGFAEYQSLPAANALPIESALSDAELATFMTPCLTAEHMLNRAGVAAGETVLVTGASGGVGSALVRLASLRGARVIGVVGAGKEAPLRALGVAGLIPRGAPDLAGAVRGAGVDVVADTVGGDQVADLLAGLPPGGRYVTAGAIAGPRVTLDWRVLYLNHLTVIGSTMGTRAEAEQIVAQVAAGRLKPLLAGTYPLEDLALAQQAFQAKTHFGKLAIVIS